MVNVPCGRCALNLRGRLSTGQCPECGMDNSKSLAVAAVRGDPPERLDQIASGLNAQAWSAVGTLALCVAGPLIGHGSASLEVFALVAAIGLSLVSVVELLPVLEADRADIRSAGTVRRHLCALMIAVGGAVMVLPAALLKTNVAAPVGRAMVGWFLAGALLWFMGECVKLRVLENCAAGVPGWQLVFRARNLRIGGSLAAILLALGLIPAAAARPVPGALLVVGSVTLLVMSSLSALLYSRVSQSLQEQAAFARAVRHHLGLVEPGSLPDEPDWPVGEA